MSGNLPRNVETRFLPNGTAIGSFTIANNRKWNDKSSGEKKEEVSFIEVTVFGKQAEMVAQYFKKGSPILVTGRLKQDTWEDKQTQQKRSKIGIVMESFEFMGGKKDGSTQEYSAPSSPRPAAAPTDMEDDVPFARPPQQRPPH